MSSGLDDGVPAPGDPRVEEALRRLDDLSRLPLEEQVPAYDEVHAALQHTLATLDEG